ncbi:MAG: Rieske 2Fe-2S domain-containing protein [Ramlibacter sp.]|nr:Rieske 2Fe-2S domain-containing protein [Ramlibacter sp.]
MGLGTVRCTYPGEAFLLDRRSFIESCGIKAAACVPALTAASALGAHANPKAYARVLLVDEQGQPLRAGALKPQTNYVFHYPYEATPVFLLDLGKPASPQTLSTRSREAYAWPGGVGAKRSVVAFSAICTHQLAYPTREVSFISFRKTRAQRGVQDNLIHCCAEHSQYDPSRGAEVLSGPAPQPLCAVLLAYETKADTLTAYGTLGSELFDAFFLKYEVKLGLDAGPKAKNAVTGQAVVRELDNFCRNAIQC